VGSDRVKRVKIERQQEEEKEREREAPSSQWSFALTSHHRYRYHHRRRHRRRRITHHIALDMNHLSIEQRPASEPRRPPAAAAACRHLSPSSHPLTPFPTPPPPCRWQPPHPVPPLVPPGRSQANTALTRAPRPFPCPSPWLRECSVRSPRKLPPTVPLASHDHLRQRSHKESHSLRLSI
jgi:hypothetical protein